MSLFDVHIKTFGAQLRQWHALPKTAAEALATFDAARAAARLPTSPADDLRLAALRGDLTVENVADALSEAAAAAVADEKARQLAAELDAPLASRFTTSIVEDGPWILTQMRKSWDRAVADLVGSIELVPAEATAEHVLNHGDTHTRDAWQRLGVAEQILDTLADVRSILRNRYSGWDHDGMPVAMFIEEANGQLAVANRLYRGGRDSGVVLSTPLEPVRGGVWRRLIDAGFRLRLNGPSEAQAVAATLDATGYFQPTPAPLGAA